MHTQEGAQATTTAAPEVTTDKNTVELDFPFQRGDTTLHTVTLRKPLAGELRGIKLSELLALEVGSMQQVLPRITTPTMTVNEVAQLDPADLMELSMRVAGFFVRKSVRAASLTA